MVTGTTFAQRNMSAELMRNSREIAEAISINCTVPGCAGLCELSVVSAAFYAIIVYYTGAAIHVLTVDWIVIIDQVIVSLCVSITIDFHCRNSVCYRTAAYCVEKHTTPVSNT